MNVSFVRRAHKNNAVDERDEYIKLENFQCECCTACGFMQNIADSDMGNAIYSIAMENLHLILRLDVTGQPVRWIPWQNAVVLASKAMIAWSAGNTQFTFRGGINRSSGERSLLQVSSIIAVHGHSRKHPLATLVPPLSNRELFRRDSNICMYCGHHYPDQQLTRDHVRPLSQGGRNTWNNVVTACKSCNNSKGAKTPEDARMCLVAVPYVPNRAEYLFLSNRRILTDQMKFLKKRFSRKSRLIKHPG